ncbi:hypothetical protein FZD47_11075 [Bacillus infantis]|uniref:Uncharacterized protein n=1 Tax=Bacillus infantis TaxID=324767 RepID=A0A5D4SPJ0_9BACI|nr:hypothetical protein FZD47_11075 [Bacillus infantis]
MIGAEGTKTPVGDSGKAETPQRASVRRLSAAPRKAKCLQRKSTASLTSRNPMYQQPFQGCFLFFLKNL